MKRMVALIMAMMISISVVLSSFAEEQSSFYVLAPLLASVEGVGDDADLEKVDESQYSFPAGPVLYLNFAAAEKTRSLILYARTANGDLYGCFWGTIPDKLLWYLLYMLTGNYSLITSSLPQKEKELTLVVSMGTEVETQMIITDQAGASTLYKSIVKMLGLDAE